MVKNMFKDLVAVCFTLASLHIDQCSGTAGRMYSPSLQFTTIGKSTDYSGTSDDAVMCANMCNMDDRCATFSYDSVTKTCHYSGNVVSIGKAFGPHIGETICPTKNGFRVYVRKKILLCLKLFTGVINQTGATTTCQNDAAHLVLIQDESMMDFVGDIMAQENKGDIWVGGKDENLYGYFTFEGKPLTYIPPCSVMSNSGLCLRFKVSERIFHNEDCGMGLLAFCQIDVNSA